MVHKFDSLHRTQQESQHVSPCTASHDRLVPVAAVKVCGLRAFASGYTRYNILEHTGPDRHE